jgi:spore germination cell wall hydrolase CwlJ-like protein
MTRTKEVLLRSDRVLVGALAVILAAASFAVGAAAANHPRTDRSVAPPAVRAATAAKPLPQQIAAQAAAFAPAGRLQRASATDLALAHLLAEHRCLSEVMYYEARGEGREGEMAVAEVVFHRLRHGRYGHSICAVVYEGAGSPGCQFSFTCNGELAERKSAVAWRNAEILAARILSGETALRDVTGDATHFHAVSVDPDWADEMQRTVQIGNHIFYKRGHSRAL